MKTKTTASENATSASTEFRGKVDLWLPVLLGFEMIAIAVLILAIALSADGEAARREGWIGLSITTAINVLTFAVLYGIRYVVDDEALCIYLGPIRAKRIPLDAIQAVEPARGLASPHPSFAATSARVKVTYSDTRRDKAVLLGPTDLSGFLAMLAQHAPHLAVQDQKLVRAPQPAPDVHAAPLSEALPLHR